MSKKNVSAESYLVSVDYSRALAEVVKDIEKNFWIQRPNVGTGSVEIFLIHFNKVVSTTCALQYVDNLEWRPGCKEELDAFGEKHPDIQRKFSLIALGSVSKDLGGYRCVPSLNKDCFKERPLLDTYFDGPESSWDDLDRFLAVSK